VHLRRALLLFAIVLGLAAIATSLSRPNDESDPEPASPATGAAPTATPRTDSPPVELTFAADGARAQRVVAGQAATVLVEVDEPGQAEIADLGVSATADPLTPARFELLASRPGRYPISFTPASGGEPREAGTLVVRMADE
jgi:hypothetical protein